MRIQRTHLIHSLFTGIVLAAALAGPSPAIAAPAMCTRPDADPKGVTATHLFAKIDGQWVEPQNVCVAAWFPAYGGMHLAVSNTVDGAYPETHLPPGTLISVGIRRPPGVMIQNGFGGWRDAVIVSDGSDTVVQAKTVGWDYHPEAFFGGPGLDCSATPVVWPSTFSGWFGLTPMNPDGTPNIAVAQYAGAYYESNTVGVSFPTLLTDSQGNPAGVQIDVQGCGDEDPSTYEGYFDGFTPVSQLHAVGFTDDMLRDPALLQQLLEVDDQTTGSPVKATFTAVTADDLKLEPVPGVTLPTVPTGPQIVGVSMRSQFSYSKHTLVQRGRPQALEALRSCRGRGGTPTPVNGQLTCKVAVPLTAKLAARRSLRAGRSVTVTCNKPCSAVANARARGKTLARGRASRAKAGKLKVPMKLTRTGRRWLALKRSVRVTLRVTVRDRDGHSVLLRRPLRLTR